MWFYHHVWAVQVSYWQFLVGCVPSCASKARAMCEIAGCFRFVWHYMVVSWNRGTPKSSIEGCSIINQAFWIPPVVEIPISCPVIHRSCCLKNRIETTNHGLVISNMVMNQNLFYVYTYTCTVYIYTPYVVGDEVSWFYENPAVLVLRVSLGFLTHIREGEISEPWLFHRCQLANYNLVVSYGNRTWRLSLWWFQDQCPNCCSF